MVGLPGPSNSVQRDHSWAWRGSRSDRREALTAYMKQSAALQVCIRSCRLYEAENMVLSCSSSPLHTLQYWIPPHHCAPSCLSGYWKLGKKTVHAFIIRTVFCFGKSERSKLFHVLQSLFQRRENESGQCIEKEAFNFDYWILVPCLIQLVTVISSCEAGKEGFFF